MRAYEESTFETVDGAAVFYRHWPAVSGESKGALVLLHRGHEHSGRLQHLVDELNLPAFAMFAWDARGHGRSPGQRGYAPSVAALVKDLDTFVHNVIVPRGIPIENIGVIGQSVGSVIAAAWVHDYAPKIRCMILAAPAFQVKLYVPFARAALRAMCKIRGDFSVKSYVNANYLTHDRSRAASYRADPLISRDISVRVLLDLYETGERVVKDAAAIQAPTQLLLSGSDVVVRKKPQLEFFGRLGSTVKEKHELQGFYHDTFGEKDRHFAIEHARRFVLTTFSQPRRQCSLLHADTAGAMKEEFDRLRTPLNPVSQAAARFTIVKTGLKAGTLVSHGIRVGAEKGFDSGAMLDYVYRNQPSGFTPVGRLVDRMYLDSIGWRGIRVRKQHLEALLARATAELRAAGMPVNIIDVAAGHGRYILDSVGRGAAVDHILLRDFSADNVARGSQLIRERGLHQVAEFERADAFDRAGLAAVAPRPTLGVVSGLYELFPENETVGESLRGLADAIDAHGYLIYTGQPWHPQLELIARTLTSHRDHQPWVMRRRSQAELDELAESAGFRKVDQLTDEWGIFTVSLAQRMAS